MILFLPKT